MLVIAQMVYLETFIHTWFLKEFLILIEYGFGLKDNFLLQIVLRLSMSKNGDAVNSLAPKRPLNAYMEFSLVERKKILEEVDQISTKDINKEIWYSLEEPK